MIADLVVIGALAEEIGEGVIDFFVLLHVVDGLGHAPGQNVLVFDKDFANHDFGSDGVDAVQQLSVDVEERVVSHHRIDLLAHPNLVLLAQVILLLPHVHEVGQLQAHYEQEVVGVRSI